MTDWNTLRDTEPVRPLRLATVEHLVEVRANNPEYSLSDVADEVGVPVDDARNALQGNVPAVNDLADWEYEGPPWDDDDDDPDAAPATARWDE